MTRRRVLVIGWLTVAISVALAAIYVFIELSLSGLTVQSGLRVAAAVELLGFPTVGLLVVSRQPKNPVAWFLLAGGIQSILLAGNLDYAGYALVVHPGSLPFGEVAASIDNWIWAPALASIAGVLPLTFPDGRLLSRRWRPLLWTTGVFVVIEGVSTALTPGSIDPRYPSLNNPIGVTGWEIPLGVMVGVGLVVGGITLVGVVASVVVRYHRAAPDERHQLKWVLFSFTAVIPSVVTNFLGLYALSELLSVLFVPLVAVSIGIAILRYRLYDIDLVISRTVVYGALALFITAVYVAIVVGIGALIGSGGKPNLVLSILATAVVAVGFQPVRERLQRIANRLVYGKRATPYEVLSQFSERVAESYAADDVLPRMARVLADGTGAERAVVWLRVGDSLQQAATWPAESQAAAPALMEMDSLLATIGADRAIEVRHQGESLGALTVTKRRGESLTPVEEKLLADLAAQAGLVLKNVGLTSELLQRLEDLRASRQRLVAAQDEERRRLERNLHDGAQQNLVALKVKLGLAEILAGNDPARAKALMAELKGDADEALETLRDLARGIYPPLLADRGLVAALEAQARKATLPVEVRADGIGRYSPDIEAAVYFCSLEALQNVQKYANAASAVVELTDSSEEILFVVKDSGTGFDLATTGRGSGLQNMEDRLDALGGSLVLESSSGRGTVLTGRLPIAAAVAVA